MSAYTFCTLFDNFRTDRPRGLSAATTRIIRGHYADSPRSIRGLSASIRAAVRAEQPRNSAEKVKFSVSRTVYILTFIVEVQLKRLKSNYIIVVWKLRVHVTEQLK